MEIKIDTSRKSSETETTMLSRPFLKQPINNGRVTLRFTGLELPINC